MDNIENLCFEGGGIRGIAYCGAIAELEHQGILTNIRRFAGTSVGSLFAAMLAVGFTAEEIEDVMYRLDFSQYYNGYMLVSIYNVWSQLGVHSIDNFEQQFRDILAKRVNSDITLKRLYDQTHKELVIVTCCLNRMEAVYLHHSTYPDVKLLDAMMCSMAVPFMFRPKKYTFLGDEDYYVDGGIVDNYPIWVFNDIDALYDGNLSKIEKEHIDQATLGLKLLCKDERNDAQVYQGRHEINNAIQFSTQIINTLILQVGRTEISPSYIRHTVPIQTGDVYFLDFNLTPEQKKTLIKSGETSIRNYVQYHKQ